MKRTASNQELALPSPEAKKVCVQKVQEIMPSDGTPIDDDLDDLYGEEQDHKMEDAADKTARESQRITEVPTTEQPQQVAISDFVETTPEESREGPEANTTTENTKELFLENIPGIRATEQLDQQLEETNTAAESRKVLKEIAEASTVDNEAEFEIDSSPVESSSEAESDSTSSSSSGDSDYEMLDPAEEARRLMQEDGGSDDEGKGGKTAIGPLRTLNEKPDEIVPKPQIEVTPAMTILELGKVEHVVENSILIIAKQSGENRALESGSLLCLQDRSVIGVIAEVLGQVQRPYYSVRFTNAAAIAEASISTGTVAFYVEQHSTYVFTQNLKAFKGSDASNMHDEEVGDDELEFSDDEAEAEYKRRVKQERLARKGGRGGREDGFSKPLRGGRGGRGGGYPNQPYTRENGTPTMNYDDNDDGDDLYTPLARPSNLHEIMGRGEAPQEDFNSRTSNGNTGGHQGPQRGRPDRGRGRGGDRSRGGRGGRGDRRGGGGFQRDSRNNQYNNHQPQQQHPSHGHPLPSPVHADHYPPFDPPDNNNNSNNIYQPSPASAPPTWLNQFSTNNEYSAPKYNQPPYAQQQQQHTYPPYNPYPYPYAQPPIQYPSYQDQYPQPNSPSQYIPPQPHNNYRAHSPTTPVPANIPAGAHINPAFFAAHAQQQQQQGYSNVAQQQAYGSSPPVVGGGSRSPQSEEAFKAAQENLNLLRQLSRGGGGGGPAA
ncbi:MAG: hypothetical protein Q9218_007170 [Villophora microphyllina]